MYELIGFVFEHTCENGRDLETWAVQISADDQARIEAILSKYEDSGVSTRNAYDMRIGECF